ncbi:MAG TPA: DnaA/Hda family protein, partial [Propionicimonas sp.]
MTDDLAQIWGHVVSELGTSPDITPRQLAFVRLARPLGLFDGTLLLAVGNDFTKDYLESRVRTEVTHALSEAIGREARFAVSVDPELDDQAPPMPPAPAPAPASEAAPASRTPAPYATAAAGQTSAGRRAAAEPARLNPKYVFETFVPGSSNRFAHAAALAVAEAPAKAYNPLFIYGNSGLGKTHLLHAIGHYAQNLYPTIRVRYVNSEEFTNDFINSIGEGKAGAFQRRYREVDVLLIDDIQFLQGKEQTMEEF